MINVDYDVDAVDIVDIIDVVIVVVDGGVIEHGVASSDDVVS